MYALLIQVTWYKDFENIYLKIELKIKAYIGAVVFIKFSISSKVEEGFECLVSYDYFNSTPSSMLVGFG